MQRNSPGLAAGLGTARGGRRAAGAFLATSFAAAGTAHAIVFGQLDDFEDGTTMGWVHAAPSPNPPVNVPDGGPTGAGDAFLRNVSIGGFGAGSRHVVFNQAQWTGNFNTAGVTRLTGFMNNLGTTNLYMRVAIEGGALNTRWGSNSAISLPAGSGWQPVTFDLTPSKMTLIAGGEDLATVLGNVGTFRLLSAELGAAWAGDQFVASLGVDNLRALRLQGDANFDGNVNLTDFNALAGNFGAASGATWQQGDFNFDGNVNLSDFNLLAANFGQTISGPSVTPDDWAALGAAVPEPASLAAVGAVAGFSCLRRRRARRRA